MVSARGTVDGLAQRTARHRMFKPRQRSGVIMLYGATGTRDTWFALDEAYWPNGPITGIIDAGFPVGSCDALSDWGNATISARLDTLYANLQADLARPGRVHLVGTSMGGLSVLNWAKQNPTLVRSITLLISVLDQQDVYDEDRAGFQSVIGAAHGGRPPNSLNPADNYASFADFPIQIFYSTNDVVTPVEISDAFIEGVGDNVVGRSMGAQGHFWAAPWSGAEAAEFILEHD